MGAFAWVTLATNDSYSLGALVLAHSLRRAGTQHDLAVLITPGVTQSMREKLAAVYNLVKEVNVLDSNDEVNLSVLQRPELGITFTKLHCWRLTEYEKCVFVDADALVVRNCDELFEREELSAAPDVGWPDCFNSGVFVFKPSLETFAAIATFAASQGSFDGADQGLLNMYFSDWAHKDISKHLPFIYNMCSTATYSYAPAFKQYGTNVKIIHFIGNTKPWMQYFDTITGMVQVPPGCDHLQPLMQMWWNIFCENVHPQLSDVMGGLAGALSRLTMGEVRTEEQRAIEDHIRKQNWEQGQIDFMGQDSFDNILQKINETLASVPPRQQSPVKETRQPKKSSRKSSEVETAVEESDATLPVLDTEDQTKIMSTQEISEDACQTVFECASSPMNTKQELAESLSIIVASEVDEASNQKMLIIDESANKSLKDTVHIVPSVDVSQTVVQDGSGRSEVILDIKPTDQESEIAPASITEIPPNLSERLSVIQQTKTKIGSEVTTECPVPVQVAESVLQAEPKETVSKDPRPVTEAVASSIISLVQESAASVSEAFIQPEESDPLDQVVKLQESNGNGAILQTKEENILSPSAVNDDLANCEVNDELLCQIATPTEQQKLESHAESVDIITTSLDNAFQNEGESSLQKLKVKVELQPIDTIQKDSQDIVSVTEQQQISQDKIRSEISSTHDNSLVATSTEPPVRPGRSKDLKIPGTPIVIGPTPPTSPPLETDATLAAQESTKKQIQPEIADSSIMSESQVEAPALESLEKLLESQQTTLTDVQAENYEESQVQAKSEQPSEKEEIGKKSKKIVKKSSAESDTPSSPESEGSGKKNVKKVVKKVSKKNKTSTEGDEGDGGNKSKKTAKTAKKLSKTSPTSLEMDADVPETLPSPSPSSDPPVPPKRKSKSSSHTKVTDK